MTININITEGGPVLQKILERITTLMAKIEDFDAKFVAFDAAIADVAADIEALKAQVAGGGLSAAEEADVLAKLDTKIAALAAVGAAQ